MEEKSLIEWAIKGIHAEIDQLEKDINTGRRLLRQYERGEKPKTSKTPDEIRDIIAKLKAETEELNCQRVYLTWRKMEY